MPPIMRKLLVFPTWVLVRMMRPVLAETHPFKKVSLRWWAQNTNDLCNAFSILFWGQAIVIPIVLFLIHNK